MAGFAGSESVYVVPILLADLPFGIGKYSRFLPKASCSQIEFCPLPRDHAHFRDALAIPTLGEVAVAS